MRRLLFATLGFCMTAVVVSEDAIPPLPPGKKPLLEDGLSTVLPGLEDVPDGGVDEDPWILLDEPMVDPGLLKRKVWTLPPAASLLPPVAIVPSVRRFQTVSFTGNTVFSTEQLSQLTAWWMERPVGPEERAFLEDAITELYISEGYINSGAVVPEPPSESDTLVVNITEGKLTDVVFDRTPRDSDLLAPDDACVSCLFTSQRRLSDSYLTSRVLGNRNMPLDFYSLQQRLQILQMNPNIKRLQAELKPGLLPGEASVNLVVEENPRWSFGMELHNQLPPSVGAEQLDLWVENGNLTGSSDVLMLRYGVFGGGVEKTKSSGFDNMRFSYSRPIRWDDTMVDFFYDRQGYAIIEPPFTELDITGSTWSAGVGLGRPILRNLRDTVWWRLSLARKHSETDLLGEPFSVSPGYVNGKLDLSLLQVGVDWIRREETQVLTASGALLAGLDAMGATNVPDEPDSSFLVMRANASYLARLNSKGHLLFLRGAAQWSDDRVPSPEQWTLGGYSSVRGYRENELVRDSGAYGSVEYRIPLWTGDRGGFKFISFFDAGMALDRGDRDPEALCSAGVGLTGNYRGWLFGEFFWGFPLVNRNDVGNDLQDHGFGFRINVGRF